MTLTEAQFKGRTAPLLTATIGQHLDEVAARDPDHLALIMPHQEIRWSYGTFVKEVNRLATGLLRLGLDIIVWIISPFAYRLLIGNKLLATDQQPRSGRSLQDLFKPRPLGFAEQ